MKKKILLLFLVFLSLSLSARFFALKTPISVSPALAVFIEGGGGGGGGGEGGGGGGGGNETTCFPAGTKVLLSDLSEKNIEDVKVGDLVLSFDGSKNIPAKVLSIESPVRDHLYTLMLEDGTSLRLTREHPVYTQSGWKSLSPADTARENPKLIVDRLQINDKLQKSDGTLVQLVNITYQPGKVQTYNLKNIEKAHTFYADGYLVHNKVIDSGGGEPPGQPPPPGGDAGGNTGGGNNGGGTTPPEPTYYNIDSNMPPDIQGLYNTAAAAADTGGQIPGTSNTASWEGGNLVVRDANGNPIDVFYRNETGGGGSGGGGSGGGGGTGDGGTGGPTPTPPPGCTPTATTCGACLSSLPSGSPVSCGGGLQHCTNNCPVSGWNQACNTQPCCTNTNPDISTLNTPTDNAVLGNTNVTVNWNEISNFGINCSTGSNSYKVYIDTNPNPSTLVCTVAGAASTNNLNLVGFWKFDETTGPTAADSSGNGHNGTATGTTIVDGQPGYSKARSFSGSDYVNFPLILTQSYDLTMSAWVKMDQVPTGSTGGIVYNGNGGGTGYGIYVQGAGAGGCASPSTAGTVRVLLGGKSCDAVSSTYTLTPGSWTYLSLVRTAAGQWQLYANGTQVASGTAASNSPSASDSTQVGTSFIGSVDDVKIFNKARTSTEIQQDMAATQPPAPLSTQNCAATLNDQTTYYWKVVTDNGVNTATSVIRSFRIAQPKICGGTLFEDTNQNGCYETSSESPVSNNTITVSAAPGGTCTTNADNTYCCTIPGTNDGTSTLVNLTASNYNPPYTGKTNCSTGTDASCSLNNCSISLNAGDTKAVHIGFAAKSWFQADSCPVYSNSDIVSLIPASPLDFDTGNPVSKYFVLNNAGPVLSGSATAMNFGTSGGLASLYKWADINYQTTSSFNFAYFEKKLGRKLTQIGSGGNLTLNAGKLSDGTNNWNVTNNSVFEVNGSLTVENDTGLSGVAAVILTTGDITINSNFEPTNSYLALISKTNIAVAPTVTKIHAVLFADGQFSDGVGTSGLKVTGSVIALNGFNLQRSSATGKPAEFFVCDAGMYINLSSLLGISTYRWEESAP